VSEGGDVFHFSNRKKRNHHVGEHQVEQAGLPSGLRSRGRRGDLQVASVQPHRGTHGKVSE
jgi:hypothetical protein